MKQPTTLLLQKLNNASLFENVGKPPNDSEVRQVLSWSEAIESCSSEEWENLTLEAQNILTEELSERHLDKYLNWNDRVVEIKTLLNPIIIRQTQSVTLSHNLPKVFRDSVSWDLTSACLETDYGDEVNPGFFLNLLTWYLRGHFPCGWEGEHPKEGRLIIY